MRQGPSTDKRAASQGGGQTGRQAWHIGRQTGRQAGTYANSHARKKRRCWSSCAQMENVSPPRQRWRDGETNSLGAIVLKWAEEEEKKENYASGFSPAAYKI